MKNIFLVYEIVFEAKFQRGKSSEILDIAANYLQKNDIVLLMC